MRTHHHERRQVNPPAPPPVLTGAEFEWIRRFLFEQTGISLKEGKQALVSGRLDRRLRHYQATSYMEYFSKLGAAGNEAETTLAIDLLTTNETYFMREPKHFEYIKKHILPHYGGDKMFRAWSAASSTGEEAYTLAMTAFDVLGADGWEIIGTDISTRVVAQAKRGLYPIAATEKLPGAWLKKYCLKGKKDYKDFFTIRDELRNNVSFYQANLLHPLPSFGRFDVIFLRNVMIYFEPPTKKQLLERMLSMLQPHGYFIVSHSESLNGLTTRLKAVQPSIYQLAR